VADKYANYAALSASEVEGVDYQRRSVPVTGSTWSSIAVHGGSIEPGSGEVARAVGAGLMAHYEFAGIKSANNTDLHLTSTNFDEPTGVGIVTSSIRCLSAHGFTGTTGLAETAIGGLDLETASRVRVALQSAGFLVSSAAQELNGSDPANITNRTATSSGVQLEMSRTLRESFFPGGDLSRTMRDSGQRTATFNAYVAAVRSAFDAAGVMSQGSVNVSRWATVPWVATNVDFVTSMATDKLAVGGSHFLNLAARFQDTNNCYLARLAFNTDKTLTLTLRKRVASTETLLATASGITGLRHAPYRRFLVRMQLVGSTLNAKVWQAGTLEPATWQVTAVDTSLSAAGAIGMRSILSSTNTNTLPVRASYTDFTVLGSQTFTVARSVNGVVKAQSAGTPVDVASPAITSL
jgi:phage replication-related protein YjqB (UPF0714/DUF867 family)